jgi:hypothetical protein
VSGQLQGFFGKSVLFCKYSRFEGRSKRMPSLNACFPSFASKFRQIAGFCPTDFRDHGSSLPNNPAVVGWRAWQS